MKNTIDIDIRIDPARVEPRVIIETDRMTPDIDKLVHAIENSVDSGFPMIAAYDGETLALLSQREIMRVFIERRKLVIQTDRGCFTARKSLAEIEASLNPNRFLRISRSEIINLSKVTSFDFSLSGTIQVHFDDGTFTWVARRYVRSIQQTLGLM